MPRKHPHFGQRVHNAVAGESNPHRNGFFVEARRRTGRMNPGTWYRLTDGKGDFWEVDPRYLEFDVNALPLTEETAALTHLLAQTQLGREQYNARECWKINEKLHARITELESKSRVMGCGYCGAEITRYDGAEMPPAGFRASPDAQ